MADWLKITAIFTSVFLSVVLLSEYHGVVTDFKGEKQDSIAIAKPTTDKKSQSQWKTPFTTDELSYVLFGEGNSTVSSRDPRYLDHVRSLIARPNPSKPCVARNSDNNQFAAIVDKRLRQKEGGFFIECGAANGDSWSNTMFLERQRKWTGLLVEANKRYVKEILKKNRQAYFYGGCLSPFPYPTTLPFKAAGDQGGLRDHLGAMDADIKRIGSFESVDLVYCVPLGDLLAAIEVDHVDFLSLDVQGAELSILKTVDFKSIRIDIIILEAATAESTAELRAFFNKTSLYKETSAGYDMVLERLDLK